MLGAERARRGGLGRRRGQADHRRTRGGGELHDRAAGGAGGRLHDDGVTGAWPRRRAREHTGGRSAHRDRGGNVERHVGRQRDNVRRAHGGQLRVDAREVPEVDDRASQQRGVGARARRDHLAAGLDPGHERQLDRVGPALAMLEVNVVDADPATADEELVCARDRLGALDRPQRPAPPCRVISIASIDEVIPPNDR